MMEGDDGSVHSGTDAKPAAACKDSEKVPAAKKKQRQFRAKKPKDMPRRPLSAYNIFFKEERAKLLEERRLGRERGEDTSLGFEKMARTIGQRWKELAADELERFKGLAKQDTERYRKEMEAYHQGLAVKSRKEREESSRRRLEESGLQEPQREHMIHEQVARQLAAGSVASHATAATDAAARLEEMQRASLASSQHPLGVAGAYAYSQLDRLNSLAAAASLGINSGSALGPTSAGQAGLSINDTLLLNYLQQQQQQSSAASLQDGLISAAIRQQNFLARSRAAGQANQELLASLNPTLQQQLLLAHSSGGGSNLLSGALGGYPAGHLPVRDPNSGL